MDVSRTDAPSITIAEQTIKPSGRQVPIAFFTWMVSSAAGVFIASNVVGQKKTTSPDVAKLAESKGLKLFNRTVSSLNDGTKKGVRLNESQGEGLAYLEGSEITDGTIEFDVRGKDVQGQSFVGVAFHGVDATTYDAIYFRPFNFKAEDPARRLRAVQYISHPTYTWQKLRAEHPGRYEKPVTPVPDPNAWFHARVVVASPRVSVFVNDAKEPSLVVNQLSDRKEGLVGLWVGNGSGGDFANLTIVPVWRVRLPYGTSSLLGLRGSDVHCRFGADSLLERGTNKGWG